MVLIDASAAQGDAQVIAQTVRKHLHAGTDHVVAAVPMGSGFTDG